MKKCYVCFVCYSFHPEMKGVSEEEFNNGNNVCKEEKCKRKSEPLEAAVYCERSNKMFRFEVNKEHKQKGL